MTNRDTKFKQASSPAPSASRTVRGDDEVCVPVSSVGLRSAGSHRRASDYTELKRLVRLRGLLDKQPGYYACHLLLMSVMLVLSLGTLFVTESLPLQLLNAVFLAFVFTQIAFVAHDAGHRQIAQSTRKNDIISLLLGNLVLGLSRGWWVKKHNQHHANPNQEGLDPDIDIPVLAFSEEQARHKRGLARVVVKYQAYLFFPLLLVEAFYLLMHSAQFLLRKGVKKYFLVELVLLATHVAGYLGLLLYLLGFWRAMLFIVIHRALFGLFLGAVFAPNHKGMLMLDENSQIDFLRRQVLTARNLKAHPVTDFLFGPLSCQVEHHLFPNMPRKNLRAAEKIVKEFCRERGITHHATSVLHSYREVLRHLRRVSAQLH